MPPWILPDEAAMVSLNILTALDSRLSFRDGDIFQPGIVYAKERTFTSEFCIFNDCHNSVCKKFDCKDTKEKRKNNNTKCGINTHFSRFLPFLCTKNVKESFF
jgi:hypothetical protein